MNLRPKKFEQKAKDPLVRKIMKRQFKKAQIYTSIALILYAIALFYTGRINDISYLLFIIFFAVLLIQIDINIKVLDLYEYIDNSKSNDSK